jgi:hypothetical protein
MRVGELILTSRSAFPAANKRQSGNYPERDSGR